MIKHKIDSLKQKFYAEMVSATTSQDLEALKIKFMGKKGPIQELVREMKDLSAKDKPQFGKLINDFKGEVSRALSEAHESLIRAEQKITLSLETLDVTLPGRKKPAGRKHVLTQTLDDMIDILVGMGFSVQYGPDIDTDYYNFEALNFPPDHPARDMQDTFYISEEILLRTHTSNIQARIMESTSPPIRIIAPGKAYRNETITARSHVFFHQVEALYIDKNVSFSDLLSTLDEFLEKLFKQSTETRYRPSFFPFVEPGLEVDVKCLSCNAAGCGICKQTGWLEVAGAGLVHPEVLKNGDIDPEIYTGYAWGIGVERIAMLKHGIKDIRLFAENDIRFLEQFPAL